MIKPEFATPFLRSIYVLGVLLALVPLVDVGVRAYPMNFGDLRWRFGAEGILITNLAIVLTGIGLIGLTAIWLGHRRVLRALGIVCAIGALGAIGLTGLFMLDALQLYAIGEPDAKALLRRGIFTATLTVLLAAATLATMAWGAWKASAPGRGAGSRAPLAASRSVPNTIVA